MRKKVLIVLLLTFQLQLFAQNEASYWYFGQNAGLRFNITTGTVIAITDGQINTLEGCTSISDADGNLLFYSDGITVWNNNHQVMLNGSGLKGDPSSTSSGLIVPKPQDPDFYYLFTVDEPHHSNSSAFPNESDGDGVNDGLTYSRINITDDGGLGAVDATEKNIPLVTYDPTNQLHSEYKCSEKITAVKADDCSSFWVITHFADSFYAFKVDVNGVDTTPIISTVGPNIPAEGYRRNALGYLKASPDGTKLIVAHFGEATEVTGDAGGGVYLFDFNNQTGVISNSVELYSPQNNDSPYGVEFSAENKKAYATIGLGISGNGASQILQWDLESADIPNSMQIIDTSTTLSAGALQLGVDRRIYRAQLEFSNFNNTGRFLGVINNPEADGAAVNYVEQGVLLDITGTSQNLSKIGLPPFIQSLFNSEIDIIRNGISTTELKLCTGDNYILEADEIIGASYAWTLDGTPLTETSFQLTINTSGFYEVYIEPNNGDCPIEGTAVVGVFDIPIANNLTDISICDDNGNDGVFSFDFTDKNPEALLAQDPAQYNVKYFESLDDATNLENEITFPFENTSNPQTIFVRVDNVDNTNCFDVNSFQLEVFNTPQIMQLNDIEFCDNEGDETDGFATVELSDLIPTINGVQSDTSITFHATQDNADTNTDPLPLSYTNTTAINETIFVRIENTLNTDCFSTDSFNLTINNAPAANNFSVIQCDEDGIPEGFTIFNLTQDIDMINDAAENTEVTFYLSTIDAENLSNPINADAFENFFNPQLVFARVTNTITGCYSINVVTLEVSTTSTSNVSLEACDDDGTEDGFTSFNLLDASPIVLAAAPDDLQVQFYETYLDALVETNPIETTYTNTVAYNQTVYARVENSNACYGISEIALIVLELPNIETEFQTHYCINTSPEPLTLDGGVIDDAPSNYYYQWSTGETTSQIQVTAPGNYSVVVSNTLGCSKQRNITVSPSNIATIVDVQVVDASPNNSISVFVSDEGDYEYAIDSPNGPYQDSNVFDNVRPGLYTIYVRDKNNCGVIEDLVSVIGFPKFFTPNNDTVNDYWQVKGITSEFNANALILIFDRYGKLLKELDPLSAGWDGTFNGAKMPANDYWFKVTLEDGRTLTNHFALKR